MINLRDLIPLWTQIYRLSNEAWHIPKPAPFRTVITLHFCVRVVSVCPSVHSSFHPPVHPSVCQSVHPSVRPFVRPSVHPSDRLSVRPSVRPSVHPFTPSVRPSIRLSARPSIRPFIRPSVHPSVYLSFHLSVRQIVCSSIGASVICSIIPTTINSILYQNQISTTLSIVAVVNVAAVDVGPKNEKRITSIWGLGVNKIVVVALAVWNLCNVIITVLRRFIL